MMQDKSILVQRRAGQCRAGEKRGDGTGRVVGLTAWSFTPHPLASRLERGPRSFSLLCALSPLPSRPQTHLTSKQSVRRVAWSIAQMGRWGGCLALF
jgi:hypothetical protein